MTCAKCNRETTPAELIAYRGICEDCAVAPCERFAGAVALIGGIIDPTTDNRGKRMKGEHGQWIEVQYTTRVNGRIA